MKLIKGGQWVLRQGVARSANRSIRFPDDTSDYRGFRLMAKRRIR